MSDRTLTAKLGALLSPLLVRRLQKGRRLPITGFTGPYTLPADIEARTDTIYHVCAGSGAVPNYSIIKHCLAERPNLKHVLLYSNKTWGDVIYGQHLSQLAAQHPDKLRVVHSLTREPNAAALGPNVKSGRLSEALLRELIQNPASAHVYCCGPGGIHVFSPDAVDLGVIRVPEHTANMAFGDDDLRSLYITASTSVYRIRVGVPGLPAL